MTPPGALLTLVISALVLRLPPCGALTCMLASVCLLTQGEALDVLGFHFTAVRCVLLAGFLRILLRAEIRMWRFTSIDKALTFYALCILVVSTIRMGTVAELIYQIGCLYNVFLSYFIFRSLLRDLKSLEKVLLYFSVLIAALAVFMIIESITGRNCFVVFGGVSEYSMVREGHVRSEGPFRSPITAGAFGATFAMLFATSLFSGGFGWARLIGIVASSIIMLCAHSSGPLLGFLLGALSLSIWPFRRRTRQIRWCLVLSLITLHMVMKAPVWFILGRISDLVGGGGYHRSYLIDQFLRHFTSWCLLGTSETGDWMATQLTSGGADLTNQFVSDGVNGGLLGLIFSILLLTRCFKGVGKAMESLRQSGKKYDPAAKFAKAEERLLWGVGSTLVCTIGILFSVTYFDQMHVVWYFLLASCALIANAPRRAELTPDRGDIPRFSPATEPELETSLA